MEEDNMNKINYLSNMIEGFMDGQQLQRIEGIKRLPWTQSILKRTEELAYSMTEFV